MLLIKLMLSRKIMLLDIVLFSTQYSINMLHSNNLFILGYWYSIVMSSNVHPKAWKHYLKTCGRLGYQPEVADETNLLQQYKTLYTRYCKDHGLLFDPSRNLFPHNDIDIQNFSELLYLSLCEELGCESIIQIRRAMYMLMDQVCSSMRFDDDHLLYYVGSRAEGLRITKSDIDSMIVAKNNVVLNNTTEIIALSYAKSNKTFITMETQHTKPGYVRLILETDKSRTCESISSSCHNYDGKLYISSTKYREYHMSSHRNKAEVHGPCTSIKYDLKAEDYAFCLSCTSQPAAVQNWLMRCNEYKWPDSVVLEQCISLGCQLAPVGSKESPHEHLEWRISFVLMEKTIIQSLSHSQFMCYGLLKLYLKEILGSFEEINDLVSSYFMKTLLLWEIQTNSQHNVGPDSLLQVFLNCLQRLYTWVKEENCPNFFIPENNMFKNRIYGESKQTLRHILELLFTEQFYGLYRCQLIDMPYLIFRVLTNEKPSMVESIYVTEEDIETHTWREINSLFPPFMHIMCTIGNENILLNKLKLILTNDSLTDFEKKAIQTWISKVIVYMTAHDFRNIIAPNASPDIKLEKYHSCCNIFRTHDHTGCGAPLYLATLMYITGRYNPCLNVILDCTKRLTEGYLQSMYVSVNLQLTELRLELESLYQSNTGRDKLTFLLIDPHLYVSMLSVLCHYHLGHVDKTELEFKFLRENRSDMQINDNFNFQELSWQILGICAEIIGKYDEAYQSYVQAYKSPRFCLHNHAPLLRVLCLIYKLLHK